MGTATKIEWVDHTVSPWHGCTKVSEGCDNCYAAAMAPRNPGTLGIWGDDGVRVQSKSFVQRLEQWNRQVEKAGKVATVFPSLCDPFEDRPELVEWRKEMFETIDRCPWITLILLTKRPENIRRFWEQKDDNLECSVCNWRGTESESRQVDFDDEDGGWECPECKEPCSHQPLEELSYRKNVWLLTSVENQAAADKRIPELLKCRNLAPVLGLSCEPLLGPVNLEIDYGQGPGDYVLDTELGHSHLDWVIAGGESGSNARPMHPDWVRSLREQCTAAGVPFFFKQWGEWLDWDDATLYDRGTKLVDAFVADGPACRVVRVGKKAAGRLLDGVEWSQFPAITD